MRKQKKSDIDPTIQERADAFSAVASKLNTATNRDLVLVEIDKLIAIEDQAPQKDDLITELRGQITDFEEKVKLLLAENETLKANNDKLTVETLEGTKTIQEANTKITTLLEALQSLKQDVFKASTYPNMTGWQLIQKGLVKLVRK